MNTKPESRPPALIGQTKLLAFVRTMIGASQGRQDDGFCRNKRGLVRSADEV